MPHQPKALYQKRKIRLAIAIQGGGARGGYAWGVLTGVLRHLERNKALGDFELVAISGASIGALNAAVFMDGYAEGGLKGARRKLNRVWSVMSRSSMLAWLGDILVTGQSYLPAKHRMRCPVEMAINRVPLKRKGTKDEFEYTAVDFERINRTKEPRLYISTSHPEDWSHGQGRIFTNEDVTLDAVVASCSLKEMFAPVDIDGEPYVDGGDVSNPPLLPLVAEARADVIVTILLGDITADNHYFNTYREEKLRMASWLKQHGRHVHMITVDLEELQQQHNLRTSRIDRKMIALLYKAGRDSARRIVQSMINYADDLQKSQTSRRRWLRIIQRN